MRYNNIKRWAIIKQVRKYGLTAIEHQQGIAVDDKIMIAINCYNCKNYLTLVTLKVLDFRIISPVDGQI